jgi:hypothetical protein
MVRCCGNCDAWMMSTETDGVCRAHPPQCVFLGMQQQTALAIGGRQSGQLPVVAGYFPPMPASGWCRDWGDVKKIEAGSVAPDRDRGIR